MKPSKQKRKELYIAYVLSKNHGGADEDKIIKEASDKFDKENGGK
jgi:hypothetical protein